MNTSQTLARRRFTGLLGGALALAATAALPAGPAAAGVRWCRRDPVVKIAGRTADIYLSSYTELEQAATGPATIVVSVPVGVAAELLAADPGFGGFGYDVRFEESTALARSAASQVEVAVYVPASDGSLPVRVDFAPRSSGLGAASAEGRVNRWVRLATG